MRTEILNGISVNKTTIIKLSKNDILTGKNGFKYFDGGIEFRFNDLMYDIAKKVETQDSITFLCVCDKKETALMCSLNGIMKSFFLSNPPLKNKNEKIIKYLLKDVLIEKFLLNIILQNSKNQYIKFSQNKFSQIHEIIPPPPWKFC